MNVSQHPGYLRPDSAGSSKAGRDVHELAGRSANITRPFLERFISTHTSESGESNSPELRPATQKNDSDPFMTLLFSGWNPDLPDPPVLNHLYVKTTVSRFCHLIFRHSIEVFFRCDPVRRNLTLRVHFVDMFC